MPPNVNIAKMSLVVKALTAWHKASRRRPAGLADSVITSGWRLRLVQAICLALIALKITQLAMAGVFQDEAYYWMWGQHPAISYYDHPPLNAWLLGISSSLFGWNVGALRAPVFLTFAADILALGLLSRRIGGANWVRYFWLTLLLFLSTPIFWIVTSYAWPDHVLMPAMLFSVCFFYRFFADRESAKDGRTIDLFAAAACLGIAALAKYNAAFLAVGVAGFVVFRDRPLLRQARLYLAAALTVAIQTPVVWWNFTERFASWQFILEERHQGLKVAYDGVAQFSLIVLVVVSPFLLWPVFRFVMGKPTVGGIGFARVAFVASTVTIFAVSLATKTLFHWNVAAWVVMLPFIALYVRPRILFAFQAIWGSAFAIAMFLNFSITPVIDVRALRDVGTSWAYDWGEAAEAIVTERAARGAAFVASADYTTTSLVGFFTRDPKVVSFALDTDQYDYWFDLNSLAGKDAILYADWWRPLSDEMRAMFESVTELKSITIQRNGQRLNVQRIYLAQGFRP